MKKKLVSLVLVASMALGLAACGGKTSEKSADAGTQAASSESSEVAATDNWSEYDELVEQIRKEADLGKRAELMHKAEDRLMDTWAVIPIYYYNDPYMVKSNVKGVYGTVEGTKYFYHATKEGSDTLNAFIASEPAHLDPALNSSNDGGILAANTFEGLLRYNEKGELEPACAESYEVSEDGLTYTFKLRDGLLWSNGDTLDASDFVYSWKRAADPALGADYSYLCAVFAGYTPEAGLAQDDVVASEDGKTLTVKLAAVCPYFLDLCAFPFFYPVYEETVTATATADMPAGTWALEAGDAFVCNGAYKLSAWNHESDMTYVKNDNYWDADSVNIKTLNFMLTSEQTAAYTAYQSGNLDFIDDVPVDEIENAMKSPEWYMIDQLGTYYVAFNVKADLYKELGLNAAQAEVFRHAIALLIDRQNIIDSVGKTGQKLATSYIPAGCSDGNGGEFKNKDYYSEDYDENFAEACELLESIGLYDASTGKVTKEISFPYLLNSMESHRKIGESIQADLAAVGINLTLEEQEWNVFLDTRKNGDFTFAREGWVMDYNDPINMLEMFTTNSGNNDPQFGR